MNNKQSIPSFYEIFSFIELPDIKILDVGASAIDGKPPYHNIKQIDKTIIYGFEPSPEEYEKLNKKSNHKEIYFPYALGNGDITNLNFISFYENQPLFAEIDLALRKLGFFLHTFLPIHKRAFQPLILDNNIYSGLNQVMWTDAVYVRKFTDFAKFSSEELIKIAIIMHDLYSSFDLAMLALKYVDEKENLDFGQFYLNSISS